MEFSGLFLAVNNAQPSCTTKPRSKIERASRLANKKDWGRLLVFIVER
jgi:hypothetical protein